jgi:hypothetical protein
MTCITVNFRSALKSSPSSSSVFPRNSQWQLVLASVRTQANSRLSRRRHLLFRQTTRDEPLLQPRLVLAVQKGVRECWRKTLTIQN